jgi:ferredoxin
MADPLMRVPENADGRFFVDNECIDCDTCRCIAPQLFNRNADGGYSYVTRQPENDDEIEEIREAMDLCPACAIGEVGE